MLAAERCARTFGPKTKKIVPKFFPDARNARAGKETKKRAEGAQKKKASDLYLLVTVPNGLTRCLGKGPL